MVDIRLIFPETPPAGRASRLVRGAGERSNLAPSDTLLGMEQRLDRARALHNHYRETVLVEPVGDRWDVRAMTEQERAAHFRRKS